MTVKKMMDELQLLLTVNPELEDAVVYRIISWDLIDDERNLTDLDEVVGIYPQLRNVRGEDRWELLLDA